MFTALLKNEARLQGRDLRRFLLMFAALYAIGLASIATRLPFIQGFGEAMALGMPLGIIVWVAVHLLTSYHRSLYGRQGYLAHALPVRSSTLYWAKFTWAFVVWVLATVAALVMMFVAHGVITVTNGGSFSAMVAELLAPMEALPAWQLVAFVALMLVGIATYVAQGGWIITFGMEERFRSMGGPTGPILAAVAIYLVSQVLAMVGIFLIPFGMTFDGHLTFASLLGELPSMFAGAEPSFIPLGWVPAFVLLGVGTVVWTLHSLQHHTSLR